MSALRVQHGSARLPAGTAACIGAFDGFHLGHRALLAHGRQVARHVAVVTFEPHPAVVLAPERAPRLLQTPVQRERTCRDLGVDALVLLRFDRELAGLDPATFVRRFLIDGLRPCAVIVGDDFRFGRSRTGDVDLLGRELGSAGIDCIVVPDVPPPPDLGIGELSSTAIRRALTGGDVLAARRMLGRWHSVAGRVVRGAGRGRSLGYRTANVDAPGAFFPAPGIYATALVIWTPGAEDYGRVLPSVTSLGTNPTFVHDPDAPLTLEVHVLDEDLGERLYDLEVEVSFIHRIRDELEFDDVEALVRRIDDDVRQARHHLGPDAMRFVISPRPS